MTSKNKVVIRIAGNDYTLVGVESDEYMQKIGLYIDKKMNEILFRNNRLSTSLAAVLTALNVADDFFKCRENEALLDKDKKAMRLELERMRSENTQLKEENSTLSSRNTSLQLELAKREAELGEVRSSIDKSNKSNKAMIQKPAIGYDM
ncbi:cell division protein ZapA [Ruminiclostridium sufflavum DSM 19573]|uniref:Cell division protein ZapA n=1 Tax=Ruminiclostridium sufflavum DSM 19573 TaxID=1121337 RepID=A0A318XNK1_9FIRM|nr:cell division protein ZapA [Ruminiclostridium sufflavum]PYG89206.1 cell division protein ZapA [Ruminiclostridium sufflavum DSM 19573]